MDPGARSSATCGGDVPRESQPRMLSWQKMALLTGCLEELSDLLQQRGTREKQSLGDWSYLPRQ